MPDLDFFNFFRWMLAVIATVYASVITWQSLWGWYVWLAGGDKYISILRRYLVLHGLRLRFATFWGDVILCGLLSVAFIFLMSAHAEIHDLGRWLNAERTMSASDKMPASQTTPYVEQSFQQ